MRKSKKEKEVPDFYIFVYYTSVEKPEELEEKIANIFKNINGTCVIVPTIGADRLECINPKYITDEELINKHTRLLEELHEHIKFRLDGI